MPENVQDNLELRKGESHDLRLKGNATAGYEWICTIENDTIVAVKKTFGDTHETEKKLVGASKDEIFTITGLQEGNTQLHFKQTRSWESGKPASEKQIAVTVS